MVDHCSGQRSSILRGFKRISVFSVVGVLISALNGCGVDSFLGSPSGTKPETKKEKPETDDTKSQDQLLALAGQSVGQDVSQSAYQQCSQILAGGVFNSRKVSDDETAEARYRRYLCSSSDLELEDYLYQYMTDDSNSSANNSSSGGLGIKAVVESVPVEFSANSGNQSGSSQARKYSREDAKAHAKRFRSMFCSEEDQSSRVDKTYDMMELIADKNIIDAWKECITKKQGGFFCHAQESHDDIQLNLGWDPSDLARTVLPSVELEWITTSNLIKLSDNLPPKLGTGSGIPVLFRRQDEDKPSSLQVVARDSSGKVNFSCSRSIPPKRKGSVIEHPKCGVELYREGVVALVKGRGQQCGVERYAEARSRHCGVERYAVGSDLDCPGSIKRITYRMNHQSTCGGKLKPIHFACKNTGDSRLGGEYKWTSSCSGGVHGPLVGTRQHITFMCTTPGIPASCRDERFGVETYNSCRHPDHGVDLYAECPHRDFGEIKERRPEFGVEQYKSCFVYFDER